MPRARGGVAGQARCGAHPRDSTVTLRSRLVACPAISAATPMRTPAVVAAKAGSSAMRNTLMPKLTRTFTAGAVLGSLLVVACGSGSTGGSSSAGSGESSKDPQTILNDAAAATKVAKDAHIKGSASGNGVDGDIGGGNYSGTVTASGTTYDIVVLADSTGDSTKDKVFIKAAASVWAAVASSAAVGTCLGDKWIEMDSAANPGLSDNPGASQVATGAQSIATGVGSFADLGKFATGLTTSAGTITKGSVQSINGQDAVELKNSSGSLFVANDGTPYVLRITGSSSTQLDLTNWSKGVSFTAPDGAQPLLGFVSCLTAGGGSGASPSPS